MKKIIKNIVLIFGIVLVFPVLNCEISLGEKLDVSGPDTRFISPGSRANVKEKFLLTGLISDYSEISKVVIKVKKNDEELSRQWKYEDGIWWILDDNTDWTEYQGSDYYDENGAPVQLTAPEWDGNNKSGTWKLPIDLTLIPSNWNSVTSKDDVDGQYLFSIQSWDKAGFSDDKSFKTLTIIVDSEPPVVSISRPPLYMARYSSGSFTNLTNAPSGEAQDLSTLHGLSGVAWQSPERIGKFVTRSFLMNFQIEEQFEIAEIDIRFYAFDAADVDNNPVTSLPDTHIYQYKIENPNPNGAVQVPALDGPATDYSLEPNSIFKGHLKNPISVKTTIMVAYYCKDKANNESQEKVLGCFIYWPEADEPWIKYTDKMKPLDQYNGGLIDNLTNYTSTVAAINNTTSGALVIYPTIKISANAFHYHGLKRVDYQLHRLDYENNAGKLTLIYDNQNDKGIKNTLRDSGVYSTGFAWDMEPPLKSAIYVLTAWAVSYNFTLGDITDAALEKRVEYQAVFKVQDISYPNIDPPEPEATYPLFEAIGGTGSSAYFDMVIPVDDAGSIKSLCLVWINPNSEGYKEMAQLDYFRDAKYHGWTQALALTAGAGYGEEYAEAVAPPNYPHSPGHPNRLWNLTIPAGNYKEGTGRTHYLFNKRMLLSDLLIGTDKNKLTSQVFLLRAENTEGKTTIITYAPQGDTEFPNIVIEKVSILNANSVLTNNLTDLVTPNNSVHTLTTFSQVEMLQDGQRIMIEGTWSDNSAAYLSPDTYLFPKMNFYIGTIPLTSGNSFTNVNKNVENHVVGKGNTSGKFRVITRLGGANDDSLIKTSVMKDSLVVKAEVEDFGGNPVEHGASWLIKSDKLKFLRISSQASDKAYTNDALNKTQNPNTIDIFLEFSKPVMLSNPTGIKPRLTLNSATGAYAEYKDDQNQESTRQYFTYNIQSGHNAKTGYTPEALDVSSLNFNGSSITNPDTDGYIFEWVNRSIGTADEKVKIISGNDDLVKGYFKLPTGKGNTASLISGKTIEIDTENPVPISFTGTTGWHSTGKDIYINVKFNKPVNIGSGANAPYLVLGTGGGTDTAKSTHGDVRVNGDTITFYYQVKATDTSSGNGGQLVVEKFGGTITDIPGKAVASNAFDSVNGQTGINRVIPGVYIDTATPSVPTLVIQYQNGATWTQISSTVSETSIPGTSNYPSNTGLAAWDPSTPPNAANINNLGTLYNSDIRLVVTPSGSSADRDYNKIEYSTNYGKDWKEYTYNSPINWGGATAVNGVYQLTARQTDKAGNVSNWAKPVVFNWDKGDLVNSIDSVAANGTYTNNTERKDKILITMRFRKAIKITGSTKPSIRLNTNNGGERATNIEVKEMKNQAGGTVPFAFGNLTNDNNLFTELVFEYEVAANDHTNNTDLRVTSLQNFDNAVDYANVSVSSLIKLPTGANLDDNKDIKVQTGALSLISISFATTGTGVGVNSDNSYGTKLQVEFNNPVKRGKDDMTIIQTVASFRLPAVLTETQRNRYRNKIGATLFDEFYKVGTNGLLSTGAVDTSTKYILAHGQSPTTISPSGTTGITGLAEQFRKAEGLSFNANAQAISFSTDGKTMIVDLTGTNALQVPGGSYEVVIPVGFVQDELSAQSPAISRTGTGASGALTAGGIARPFVRVNKKSESVDSINTGTSLTYAQPRFVAKQPFQTEVKMDTRTPNTQIRYRVAPNVTNNDDTRNPTNTSSNNWTDGNSGTPSNPTTANVPGAPNAPAWNDNTTTSPVYSSAITIGNDNEYQGYIWRVIAKAFPEGTLTATSPSSANTGEMAFKTVLTYQILNMGNPGSGQQRPQAGDMIWIRGGDAISSSSVPNYPLTWEDDYDSLKADKKRAGMRLMTQTTTSAVTNNNLNGTWKWISWEINVDTYIDFIMARDDVMTTTNSDNLKIVNQYGPKQWAYQRAYWTSFKNNYRLFPGKHRWCTTSGHTTNSSNKGDLNFSGTWSARKDYVIGDVSYP